jgi:ethanolamine utilization protein EutA (predicted chaperonin)
MSLNIAVNFALQVIGDGVAAEFTADLNGDPFFFSDPTGTTGFDVSPLFDNRQPAGIVGLSTSGAGTVTATISKSMITFTFSVPPADGNPTSVRGILLF